ncbi:alpha-galactosidase AgaA [Lachnospiraceae bacterium]|nr:alpha-galactosidase AgaA [Lachnospiraceae bacterium]
MVVTRIRPEYTYGSSRFDLYVEADGKKIFIEVKGVTLEEDGVVRFPDAPSERAVKHVEELKSAVREGYEAYVFFVVQMKGVRYFTPNMDTHPAFGEALFRASKAGVHILAYDCETGKDYIHIEDEVPVVFAFDMTRISMGINPEDFAWELNQGESFQTPEVVMVYSDQGLNKMSQIYHRLYRTRLMRGVWRDQARPILLNNWEATYFDFDEEKILNIARKAREVGVELFVLDDGWFGARNDDYRGLGDWYVNLEKLPDGISGLSRKVEELGLKFGLWVELEMVNKDSDLYRAHPDWLIGVPDRFESHARHQHVLDFSRKEVVDHIYEMIAKVIRESSISYIKWDMNRYMTEPYSRNTEVSQQGMVMHRYILGVYDLYTRLTTEFPEILFESCASGGARFDPGMLYFAPQTWTSDDTDANERTKIQYGTSMVYPLVSMGSHVSAVPNHQLHRSTSLATRANVAYFGTFGYELDLNLLEDREIEKVKKQIQFMKEYRELIQVDGDFYRLISPFEGNETAWMVVSQDKKNAVAGFYQCLNRVNGSWIRLKLQGLCEDSLYEISYDTELDTPVEPALAATYGLKIEKDTVKTYKAYGSELMYAGIPIDRNLLNNKSMDFSSLLFVIKQVSE